LRTHLRSQECASRFHVCHTNPLKLSCHVVHTSLIFRARVSDSQMSRNSSQTLVSRCVHISELQRVRASRFHRLWCHVAHTSQICKCARLDCTDVTQPLSDFAVSLCTHLSSSSACMSTLQMSHNSSQTLVSPCAHISLRQVHACQLGRCLSQTFSSPCAHISDFQRVRASSCQTFTRACTHISDLQVRAPRSHRCHSTSLRLWCHVAHTSQILTRVLVKSVDDTQPFTDFGVTLRTHHL
jgi:hypothetical protein